jgi:hypothetical protein
VLQQKTPSDPIFLHVERATNQVGRFRFSSTAAIIQRGNDFRNLRHPRNIFQSVVRLLAATKVIANFKLEILILQCFKLLWIAD